MPEVHLVVGVLLIVLNLAAGILGGVAWFGDRASVPFWYLLRAAQAAVVLQALLGLLLLVTNHEPPDDLHLLYGILPLLVSFMAVGSAANRSPRDRGTARRGSRRLRRFPRRRGGEIRAVAALAPSWP